MTSPTIREALGNKEDFPPELVAQAKNLYEAQLAYTGHAERAVAGIVRDMAVLTLTTDEAKEAIGNILDLKGDVDSRADKAFATIAKDFHVKKAPEEPKVPQAPSPSLPPAGSTGGTTVGAKDPLTGEVSNGSPFSSGTPAPIPSPSAMSQEDIAKAIQVKIDAEKGKGGNTNQGPDSQPKSDGQAADTVAASQTGLASPATVPAGADLSKPVV